MLGAVPQFHQYVLMALRLIKQWTQLHGDVLR